MKNLKKISLAIILVTSVISCGRLEAKYCSKDCCKTGITRTTLVQGNDSTKMAESNNMKNDSLKFYFSSQEPLVCLLTGEEQAERKQILQKEIFSQVRKVEEVEHGYVFYFEYEENFLMKMTDYVIAENNCCPFLTFETTLHSKEDVILKVWGSSRQAKEMIKMVLIDKK